MTTEEKANAYDNVREKIAIRFGSNVAEEIFSEFEMSEDERIRKALIDGFKRYDDGTLFNGCLVKEILSWLEKQGEQKIDLDPTTDLPKLSGYVDKDSVEYVRENAFIEKAYEFFGEHLWEYINVKNANCDTFINIDGDKLKEDFKNYMKGEKV